uniref:Putative tail fiber protein n=1 Tax=viral metagenome TaxID=1070528 RepID=A0A6M3J4H4_9ZZZZ
MAYATWNSADKTATVTLSGGDLVTTGGTPQGSVRATMGKSSGKWYWEITYTNSETSNGFIMLGVGDSGVPIGLSDYMGDDPDGYAYRQNGQKENNNTPASYGNSFTQADVIGVALDMNSGKIWFSKNDVWQNSGDPAAGTGEAYSGISGTFYPMITLDPQFTTVIATANFGASAFAGTVPSGFTSGVNDDVSVVAVPFTATLTLNGDIVDVIIVGVPFTSTLTLDGQHGLGITAPAFQATGTLSEAVAGRVIIDRSIAFYEFTLKAAGYAAVQIPIESFQVRRRNGEPSYVQVVIPGIDYADDITDRAGGEMVLHLVFREDGSTVQSEVIARSTLETVDVYEGGRNKSITLIGHKTESFSAKAVDLTRSIYRTSQAGSLRHRFVELDPYLTPGDTATVGDDTFTVGEVVLTVNARSQTMELKEAD